MTEIKRSKGMKSEEAREAARQRMVNMWEKKRAAAAAEAESTEPEAPQAPVAAPGSRAEVTAQQRRRRSASSDYNGTRLRLGYDENLIKPGHTPRWINDEKGKLEDATVRDDWDFVEAATSGGDSRDLNESDKRIRRQVGVDATGKPLYAYLCQKRTDWYESDKREISEAVTETRRTVIQRMGAGDAGGISDDPDHMYIPKADKPAVEAALASMPKIRRSRNR